MIYDDYVEYTNKYNKIYGDKTVVFIEIGSFFELYGVNNEKEVSGANMIEMGNLLNIQVSRKNKSILENSRENPLMAGFPSYALKKFVDILINNKYTNVIIEQVTPPPNPKREVTKIISPSTYIDNLTSHESNTLMVLYIEQIENWKTKGISYGFGVSTVDLSTSRTSSFETFVDKHTLNEEIVRLCIFFNPKELVICSKTAIEVFVPNHIYFHDKMNQLHDQYENKHYQNTVLDKIFTDRGFLEPIEYLDMERKAMALISFVYLLDFVYHHNEKLLKNITKPTMEHYTDNMILTNNALYQLDIVGKPNCLHDILNNCTTAMGKRYFKQMLINPIKNVETLNKMYKTVSFYIKNDLYMSVRVILKQIMDIERIIRKMHIHPFQLMNVYSSLIESKKLYKLVKKDSVLDSMIQDIEIVLDTDKTAKYNLNNMEENIFMRGVHTDLDNLQDKLNEILSYFDHRHESLREFVKMEKNEKEGVIFTTTTKKFNELNKSFGGYSSIKHRQNHVRVYNKEIEKNNFEYIRLRSAIKTLVVELFEKYCISFLNKHNEKLEEHIHFLEKMDYHSTNAFNAIRFGYTRPSITKDYCHIDCKQIRHPIIEHIQKDTKYIPNDVCIDKDSRGMILYGINAAGKSSLMKSLGIATIMAQCGMYVPSKSFNYFPYDNVHTRILSNDNLYKKQSTFTVEMSEIRNILNNSNERSLVIGDELCSGTESVSAISLVTAGVMHLSKNDSSFIFATHLHELNNMEEIKSLENVKIKHLSVKYDNTDKCIIYDRLLKDGAGDTLYGLEVCKSLDLAPEFMLCANKIRKKLLNMSESIVHNTKSVYNSRVYKDVCYICKKNAEDVHHIEPQAVADVHNRIDHYHKNSAFNLVPLCKKCHHDAHHGDLVISGYVDTSKGKQLSYKLNIKNK
jgi:DNA mismatch repair protein MutS